MKTQVELYFIAAIDSTTSQTLVTSSLYSDKKALERLYPVWCIRMILEGGGVLERLESVAFKILETSLYETQGTKR